MTDPHEHHWVGPDQFAPYEYCALCAVARVPMTPPEPHNSATPAERFDRSWSHYADDCPCSPTALAEEHRRTVEAIRKGLWFLNPTQQAEAEKVFAALSEQETD